MEKRKAKLTITRTIGIGCITVSLHSDRQMDHDTCLPNSKHLEGKPELQTGPIPALRGLSHVKIKMSRKYRAYQLQLHYFVMR